MVFHCLGKVSSFNLGSIALKGNYLIEAPPNVRYEVQRKECEPVLGLTLVRSLAQSLCPFFFPASSDNVFFGLLGACAMKNTLRIVKWPKGVDVGV